MANIDVRMSVEEWRERHAGRFSYNGHIGGNLISVDRSEAEAGSQIIDRLPRHIVLMDSFMGFFLETLVLARDRIRAVGWSRDAHYPAALVCFSNMFRRFRCCEVLFMKGYAFDGYALMRDLKDRAFLLAGVARNMATFTMIMVGPDACDPSQDDYANKTTRSRKNIENLISRRMSGKDSGLSIDIQNDLKRWDQLFNYEVHGGILSFAQEVAALYTAGKAPSIGPMFDDDALAMYVNRSVEIGWLVVRLLPFLQMSLADFGSEWEDKRAILDESFRYMVEELGLLGKKIGDSLIAMVDTKFSFKQPFHYFEADGTT